MKQEEKTKNAKEKIVKNAFELFSSKGYEATTTQDIVDRTELSRGAMYHHFKSKQDILECVIREAQGKVNTFFAELAADQSLSAKEKISKMISFFADNDTQKQLIQYNWVEKIPFALLEEIRNLNTEIAPALSEIVKQGIKNGEFYSDYPAELAELLTLCLDIWLDPVIFKRTAGEISRRLDFLKYMLEKMDAQILEKEDWNRLKELYRPFLMERKPDERDERRDSKTEE